MTTLATRHLLERQYIRGAKDTTAVNDRWHELSVECYAGYRGEEAPVRFRLADRLIEIDEVLDRWLAPDHRYFKVRTAEGTYILRHDTTSGEWELVSFTLSILKSGW